jgi:hypothetical protein
MLIKKLQVKEAAKRRSVSLGKLLASQVRTRKKVQATTMVGQELKCFRKNEAKIFQIMY